MNDTQNTGTSAPVAPAQAVTSEPVQPVQAEHATQCMIQGCSKDMAYSSHGVCRTHYKMLLKKVRSGDTTWLELENMGISAPAQYTRDPHDRDILEQFMQAQVQKAQA